jgi:DNA mismatch repair protein MutH
MNKLQALKCVEVTSQRQANNGTICYFDPITGCDYIMYESGYVRRKYSTRSWRTGNKINTVYQLNKKRIVERESTWMPGKFTQCTERILLTTIEERMECAARAVINYRNTLKKSK